MRTTSAYFFAITCLVLHAAGCGGDPSPAGSSTTGAAGGGSATSTGAGGSPATSTGSGGSTAASTTTGGVAASSTGAGGDGACIVPTGACDAPDQCGPTAPIVQLMQPLPDGQGGVVEDGTYWYTSFTLYTGAGSPSQDLTGLGFGGTVVLAGGAIHQSNTREAPGVPTETLAYSGTLLTSAKTFTMDLTCGAKKGKTTGSYTASAGKLTLYVPNTGAELVLTKQ
jgi:hypothetical protein